MQRLTSVSRVIAPSNKIVGRRSSSSQVPLYEPFPGLESIKNADVKLTPPQYQSTTLPNGARVVTVSTQHPFSGVGLFINAGSRHETAENAGAAFFMSHMGFKSSKNLTPLRLVRTVELLGGTYTISSGREHIAFSSELLSGNLSEMVPVISEAVQPSLKEFEIRDERESVGEAVKQIESNPRSLLIELLHQEAYRSNGLGNSAYTPAYNLENMTPETLGNFVNSRYTPNNVVLVATGALEHAEFVKQAEKYLNFGNRKSSESQTTPSTYTGGEIRLGGEFETYFGLAFEGAKSNTAEQHALGVLQQILGGGRSNLTEGIGRGQTSRFNRNVVEPNASWIHEINTFNFNYSDSGIFGVFAVAQRGNVARLADSVTRELSKIAKDGISADELSRGRNMYKSSVFFGTEGRSNLVDFVGRQTLATGKAQKPEEFAQSIDSVTADQVVAAAKRVLKSKPTMAILGDIRNAPTLDQIQAALKF